MRNPGLRVAAVASLFVANLFIASPTPTRFAQASVLFDNGGVVTSTTLGTGVTAGDPISQPQIYRSTGTGLGLTTAGVSVRFFRAAEDFFLPAPAVLDTFTIMAHTTLSSSQAGTKLPVVTSASVNLWNVRPETGNSPLFPEPVTLTPIASEFVAWRQSAVPGSTNGTRPIFAYTFSLAGLLGDAVLPAGQYWLEWQLDSTVLSSSARIDTPLVTPRETAFNRNFRLFGVLQSGQPPVWFESWEGGDPSFPAPYAVPLTVQGTFIPEPGSALAGLIVLGALLLTPARGR